jgi:hypothetical protein
VWTAAHLQTLSLPHTELLQANTDEIRGKQMSDELGAV